MFSNRNLTNKCDICDNVLKTISTFLNTLKIIIIVKKRYFDTKINYKFTPILFTKLANMTIVENHFLMLVIKNVHEGHKDFKCESCEKSFIQADSLRGHIKIIHEGHKDFKCDSCGKLFSYAGNMRRHIKTVHEGDKDFKSESCEKSFT